MPVTARVLTGALSATASGSADFTSTGFGTPDAAVVWVSNANSTNNPETDARISCGFWDGTNQYSAGFNSGHGLGISVTARRASTTRIATVTNDASNVAAFTISNITDGVRITLADDATTVQYYATVLLIKGVTSKLVGVATMNNGSAVDVTTPGFKPSAVFFASVFHTAAAATSNGIFSLGVAHNNSADTVSQACIALDSTDGVGTQIVNTSVNDNCIARTYLNNGSTLNLNVSVGSFDSSGFTLTPSSAGLTTRQIYYLALELPDPDAFFVGIRDSATGAGNTAYTGFGFEPLAVGVYGTLETAVNGTNTSPTGALSIGVADDTTEQCLIVGDEDAAGTTNTFSRADLGNILNLRSHTDTADAVASVASIDADGITLNYSVGSASARKMLAWAIGDTASAVLPTLSALTTKPGTLTSTGFTTRVTAS